MLTVLVVLLALSIAGCASGQMPLTRDDEVRRTIYRYNELLAQGYRSMDMNAMREVADETQSEDEYIHMSSLAEGGVRLDPELRDLKFVSMSVESTRAQVETRETWDYRHYSRANGTLLLEQRGMVYVLAYDLSHVKPDRWIVTDIRAISATATVEPRTPDTSTLEPKRK